MSASVGNERVTTQLVSQFTAVQTATAVVRRSLSIVALLLVG
jgi:hypothetical protein